MAKACFYSQHGEDVLLSKFFRDKVHGFFIEVGAFDGVHLSNSLYFEKLGWRGICIEAHPRYFLECKTNRPNSLCIHAACTENESLAEVTFNTEELGLLSGIEQRDDIQKRYEGRGLTFSGFQQVVVPAITLNQVLDNYGDTPEIDFLSIDVEGHEIEVLKGLSMDKYRPRILLVEANTHEDEIMLDQYILGEQKYYKSRRIGANILYCRDSLDAQLLLKLRIGVYVSQSRHPLGDKYDLPHRRMVDDGFFSKAWESVKGWIK